MYYDFPSPSLRLLFSGLCFAMLSGWAFNMNLKAQLEQWKQEIEEEKTIDLKDMFSFFYPFMGMSIGTLLFLGAGLEVFLYSRVISFAIAAILTLLTAALVWSQLRKLLTQLLENGSKSLDLDNIY